MKKYLVSAFALCLVSASTTAGAEQQRRGGSPQGGGHSAPSHARPMGHPATNYRRPATHHVVHHTTVHHVWHHHYVSGHVVHHATIHGTRPAVRSAVHVNVGIGGLRRNITAAHRFHAGDYRAPPGYAYRRWTFGERLPSEYFARDFWISDYLNFDLVGPPDGYTWVRFGPDALLIDEDTGEIVQVEYGVFY